MKRPLPSSVTLSSTRRPPETAAGCSLLVVGLSALVGVLRHSRDRTVDYKLALQFGFSALPGVIFSRTFLTPLIPAQFELFGFPMLRGQVILLVFSLIVILAALAMLHGRGGEGGESRTSFFVLMSQSVVAGMVTGFVGVGGGFIFVIVLIQFVKVPVKNAVATSVLIIAIKCLGGFLVDPVLRDDSALSLLAVAVPLAVLGILSGIQIGKRLPADNVKSVLGYFLLILGTAILVRQFV